MGVSNPGYEVYTIYDCMQKNIRNQVIEGILDGDTVEDLLQVKDLSLDKIIQICQAQEATKKQCTNMSNVYQESVAAVHTPLTHRRKPPFHTAPNYPPIYQGCGCKIHSGGRARCPAFNLPYNSCGKLGHFTKVCRSSRYFLPEPSKSVPTTSTNELSTGKDLLISNISHVAATDPAPKIPIHITSPNGSTSVSVLPDSGTDISTAREAILQHLNKHVNNLLPSSVIPKVANGTEMHPVEKLPITLKLGSKEFPNKLHIYPNVCGVLISWKACKGLGILPNCYPHPPVNISMNDAAPLLTKDSVGLVILNPIEQYNSTITQLQSRDNLYNYYMS